jgi:hypothetical protein
MCSAAVASTSSTPIATSLLPMIGIANIDDVGVAAELSDVCHEVDSDEDDDDDDAVVDDVSIFLFNAIKDKFGVGAQRNKAGTKGEYQD